MAVSEKHIRLVGTPFVPLARARDRFLTFYAIVVGIQALHVVEHVVQIVQVYALGVPEERALGLLGEVAELQGTEEWLHLGFNSLFLASLAVIAVGLWRRRSVPLAAVAGFFAFALGLEAWHMVEHGVIIANVVSNHGCPCPGILDARLGVSDTVLHFVYNTIAFAATAIPFAILARRRDS